MAYDATFTKRVRVLPKCISDCTRSGVCVYLSTCGKIGFRTVRRTGTENQLSNGKINNSTDCKHVRVCMSVCVCERMSHSWELLFARNTRGRRRRRRLIDSPCTSDWSGRGIHFGCCLASPSAPRVHLVIYGWNAYQVHRRTAGAGTVCCILFAPTTANECDIVNSYDFPSRCLSLAVQG